MRYTIALKLRWSHKRSACATARLSASPLAVHCPRKFFLQRGYVPLGTFSRFLCIAQLRKSRLNICPYEPIHNRWRFIGVVT